MYIMQKFCANWHCRRLICVVKLKLLVLATVLQFAVVRANTCHWMPGSGLQSNVWNYWLFSHYWCEGK